MNSGWIINIITCHSMKLNHSYKTGIPQGARVSFYLSPDPLLPVLPHPQSSNTPPPPGVGCAGVMNSSPGRA